MPTFAKNMKTERLAQNLSQEGLSKISGVSQQAISMIEAGKRSPTEDTMIMIAEGLGCTVSYLLSEHRQVKGRQEEMNAAEQILLNDYRSLSPQGREYIRQQMSMALKVYPGQSVSASDMAE